MPPCAVLNLLSGKDGVGNERHAGEPRNRALADIEAAGNAALRLTGFEALAGLFLLVRGEGRLATEFDAVGLGVGPAARGAFGDAVGLQLGGNAKTDLR